MFVIIALMFVQIAATCWVGYEIVEARKQTKKELEDIYYQMETIYYSWKQDR